MESQEETDGENRPATTSYISRPATPASDSPSNSHLSLDARGLVDPTYGFHPLSSADYLAREDPERERFYGPGHFANSQLSLTINDTVNDNTPVRTEDNSAHLAGSAAGLGVLPQTPTRAPPPSIACSTPDPSTLDLEVSAYGRLISRAFSPHELISLIEEIFTRKDEIKMIGCLGRDAAQTFIDVAHEVRPTVHHPCGAV